MGNELHLVVDGSFVLHQAIPYNSKEEVGPHVSSYNFIRNLSLLSARLRARRITVCWDGGVPESRRVNCPSYKKSRVKVSSGDRSRYESFGRNSVFLRQLLPLLSVRSIVVPGFEADDLIFGCVAASKNCRTVIVSGDMDLAQLISASVEFHRPGKPPITESNIQDIVLDSNYDIRPRTGKDVVIFKALRGDSSDSIPPMIKPKSMCRLWEKMRQESLPPTVEAVRKACLDLGIEVSTQFEKNMIVVDLVRSGVAAEAVSAVLASLGSPTSLNESDIYNKLLDVGIQPGYVHGLLPTFHYLT